MHWRFWLHPWYKSIEASNGLNTVVCGSGHIFIRLAISRSLFSVCKVTEMVDFFIGTQDTDTQPLIKTHNCSIIDWVGADRRYGPFSFLHWRIRLFRMPKSNDESSKSKRKSQKILLHFSLNFLLPFRKHLKWCDEWPRTQFYLEKSRYETKTSTAK